MALSRTTKTLAKRIDLTYFKHTHPLRRARTLLIVLVGLVSLIWLIAASRHNDSIHNPGPVAMAHANFENNCSQCHEATGRRGFRTRVTDSSCLKCHDGPIHHINQISLISVNEKTAANCAACHIEHRGQQLLRASSDEHCLACHRDLPKHTKSGDPDVGDSTTAFTSAAHPPFGRTLLKDGKWFDATKLKFNHAKHLPMKEITGNCLLCHTTTADDRRYMQPVNYARHCMNCHPLDLPANGPRLAHDKMEIVRAQINSLPQIYLNRLLSDPRRDAILTKTITSRRPGAKPTTQRITESEWLGQQLSDLKTAIDRAAAADARYAALKTLASTQPTSQPASILSPTDAGLIEHFIAHTATNSCSRCHETIGEPPSVAATQPAATVLLHTEPTGIPPSIRRWFSHSQFDHHAHRNLVCLDCHAGAAISSKTSDVLLPNLESCTNCHHSSTASQRAAPANCITCHNFHDHSKERPQLVKAPGSSGT